MFDSYHVAISFTCCHSSVCLRYAPDHARQHGTYPLYGLGTELTTFAAGTPVDIGCDGVAGSVR